MRKAWILGAVLALAGCGGGRLEDSLIACPRLSLPADIADLTRYSDPEAPDLSNLLFEARIVAIQGPCRVASGSRAVEASVSVRFVVERGPAARGQPVTLPWLVAIVGPNGEVRDRQLFRLPIAFPANVTRTTVSSPAVTLRFPADAERPIQEETIMVGFALDEQELAFNRRRGPR